MDIGGIDLIASGVARRENEGGIFESFLRSLWPDAHIEWDGTLLEAGVEMLAAPTKALFDASEEEGDHPDLIQVFLEETSATVVVHHSKTSLGLVLLARLINYRVGGF